MPVVFSKIVHDFTGNDHTCSCGCSLHDVYGFLECPKQHEEETGEVLTVKTLLNLYELDKILKPVRISELIELGDFDSNWKGTEFAHCGVYGQK